MKNWLIYKMHFTSDLYYVRWKLLLWCFFVFSLFSIAVNCFAFYCGFYST